MANRRMFSNDVVGADHFLEMPLTSQALYFHLGMRADDDGFISSPKTITRSVNCGEDDLKILISKGYVIPFENGVVVIADWAVNNWIRPDRKHDTRFLELMDRLDIENGVYKLIACQPIANQVAVTCQPSANYLPTNCHTEVRLGKDSIDKVNINTISQTSESETGIYIPLADGSTYEIPVDKMQIWEKAYPGVDMQQEFQKMIAWCHSNPTKRKTRRGIERFINFWLDKAQNQGCTYRQEQQRPEPEAETIPGKPRYAADFTEYLKPHKS